MIKATPVILCGGSGTRLWPLSRTEHPKQFQRIDGNSETTFFHATVERYRARGFAEVNNRFGGNCFACHAPARQPWDFVCEDSHGCEAIPVSRQMTGALQRSDPRCGEPELQSGDRWALFKLQALVWIGTTKAAIGRIF